jgi:hypothetical protein
MKENICYVIKGKKIYIGELMEHYNGNAMAVCQHIENTCLAERSTAKYYVDLYMQGEPFIKQNSGASFACGILGAIAFVLSAFGLGIGIIVIPLIVASIIVGIVDITTMDSEIPHKHNGMIIGLVLDVFLILVTIFL